MSLKHFHCLLDSAKLHHFLDKIASPIVWQHLPLVAAAQLIIVKTNFRPSRLSPAVIAGLELKVQQRWMSHCCHQDHSQKVKLEVLLQVRHFLVTASANCLIQPLLQTIFVRLKAKMCLQLQYWKDLKDHFDSGCLKQLFLKGTFIICGASAGTVL